MQLALLLEGVPLIGALRPELFDVDIRGLAYDSRKVGPGFLFFAFSGAKTDGAQFAQAALGKGAAAIVSDRPAPGGFGGPWLQVAHGR